MKETDQSKPALNHPGREHYYSLPTDPSRELTSEEKESYKKIIQLEEKKDNIYQSLDLCSAYHLLREK